MQRTSESKILSSSPLNLSSSLFHPFLSLLRDLNTARGTKYLLQVSINRKLSGGQGTDHEQSCSNTRIRTLQSKLLRNFDQSRGRALSGEALGLVDLREHGVSGLRDDGGGETGDQTRAQIDSSLEAVGGGGFVKLLPCKLGDLLVDDEFSHCVWDSVQHQHSSFMEGKRKKKEWGRAHTA
jgi:hypothetical protein